MLALIYYIRKLIICNEDVDIKRIVDQTSLATQLKEYWFHWIAQQLASG